MSKNVYIELEKWGDYHSMWRRWGWNVVQELEDADVCQFTGGSDVSPSMYNKFKHPTTRPDEDRDEACIALYDKCLMLGIPMTGICRGGQFLNVMNGGEMVQDADGHAMSGFHTAKILESGMVVHVTSTHHQIMIPNRQEALILMEASPTRGSLRQTTDDTGKIIDIQADDIEALYYGNTNCLCYQPHPEWTTPEHMCNRTYRMFIRNYLDLDVGQ